MMWNWAPWWHWLWMAGVWLVVFLVVVGAIVALFPGRSRDRTGQQAHGSPDAWQILDERLARGDIDVDEYRRLRDELDRHQPASRARDD